MVFDINVYMKAWNQTPKGRAYRRAYFQRPDIRAREYKRKKQKKYRTWANAYMKAWRQRPDIKARYKIINAGYRRKARLKAMLKSPQSLKGRSN